MVAYGNTDKFQGDREAEFRILVQHVKDYAIFMIDTEGRIKTWNEGARYIKGYVEEEILDRNISLFLTQEDIEKKLVEQSLLYTKEHGHLEQEGWRKRKDGTLFWANESFTTIYDDEHQLKGFAKVTRDITDRYLYEQQLFERLSEKNHVIRQVFERITDGFVAFDQNWNYTFVNKAAATILSRQPEILIGKNIWTEFPEMIGYPAYKHFIAAMEEQTTVHVEDYYPFLGLWLSAVLYASPNGLSIYFQDITVKKKSAILFGETYEHCKYIIETSQEGIWLIDEYNKTVFTNRKMCEILEYSEEEMIGAENFHFIDERDKSESRKRLAARRKGVTEKAEVTFITKSGRRITTKLSVNPLYDEEGSYKGAFAMVTDITDKINLQQQLVDEKISRQKAITKAAFIAQEQERAEIGKELHDNVNQILSSTGLYLKFALAEVADKQPFIIKSLEYISTAIEEIRKYSKRLVGPSAAEVTNLKKAIIELTEDIMLVNNIKIHFKATGFKEDQTCNDMKVSLYRIVQELITNILKYANASIVTISLHKNENKLSLLVKDNGIGFRYTTARNGIGLSNIKKRVEFFNGKIRIVSSPGKGCATKIIFNSCHRVEKIATDNPVELL